MATGLGFCPNCGTPRTAVEQKFCATCGGALAALAVPAAAPTPPPAPQVEAAPPPPAWAAPAAAPTPPPAPQVDAAPPLPAWAATVAAPTPPPAAQFDAAPPPPAWAAPAAAPVPPPSPQVDYAPPPPPPAWTPQAGQGYQPAPPPYGMTAPAGQSQAKSRFSPALILVGVLLIAAVAGGAYLVTNNNKNNPSGPGASGPVASAPATDVGSDTGNGLGLTGAAGAMSKITSYRFTITMVGGDATDALSSLPGALGGNNGEITMSGTVTMVPEQAADIDLVGIHIIEVGGFDYMDISGAGTFYKTESTGMAESMSPSTLFSQAVDASTATGFKKAGSGNKNGVAADQYQATTSALSDYAASSGVKGATWSAEVWIARDGGYPVSMSVIGIGADKSVVYQMSFDITHVNDPANKVTAPTNVVGV